jgi:hypothetical protein
MKELFYTIGAAVVVFFGATSFAHFVAAVHNS